MWLVKMEGLYEKLDELIAKAANLESKMGELKAKATEAKKGWDC